MSQQQYPPTPHYPTIPPPAYSPPGMPTDNKASAPPPEPGMRPAGAPGPYPGQPGPYHPGQPGVHMTQPQMIIMTNEVGYSSSQFGPYPIRITCPNCNAQVMTETEDTAGLLTWLISGACCVLQGWTMCCCLVPFCIRECKDIDHKCPNCQAFVGSFKRL